MVFRFLWVLLCLVALVGPSRAQTPSPLFGADVSFLEEIEAGGGVFFDDGLAADPLETLVSNGITWARLRIWHTPANGVNGLDETLAAARRIRAAGMRLLLDFHYSDSWADPGKQTIPSAWAGLAYEPLRDSVYAYTFRVVDALVRQNTPPEIVQTGNEIICGMVWDLGRVCDAFNTPTQWQRLAGLLGAAREAVLAASPPEEAPRIMIHIDRGGDNAGSRWFYDNLRTQQVAFDIIGVSYYPWWHGVLDDLSRNLADLTARYQKEVIVVETGYPWTLAWNDGTNNLVGVAGQVLPGYPATPAGQKAYFQELIERVAAVPDDRGQGIFLWEPLAISAPRFGSVMENLAFFDFSGNALPALEAFKEATSTGIQRIPHEQTVLEVYPQPSWSEVTLIRSVDGSQRVDARVFDVLGREVVRLGLGARDGAGNIRWVWDGRDSTGRTMPAGVYLGVTDSGDGAVAYTPIVRR